MIVSGGHVFVMNVHRKCFLLLTKNLACSCNQIIGFGIIINYSNQKLSFFIQLCLLPKEEKQKLIEGEAPH